MSCREQNRRTQNRRYEHGLEHNNMKQKNIMNITQRNGIEDKNMALNIET